MSGPVSAVSGEEDTAVAPRAGAAGDLELALDDLRPGGDDDEAEVRAQVLAALGVTATAVKLGRYRLGAPLGKGGAGAVFEAEDDELGRGVAVKLVRARVTAAENASMAQRRLLREARLAARLSHPNVTKVFDVGRYGPHDVEGLGIDVATSGVYLVMELVDGVDLRAWLRTLRTQQQTLRVMHAAGRGLAAAHDAGLVHRDFKPGNVLVCHDGTVKVTDFGLARIYEDASSADDDEGVAPTSVLTEAGLIVGTLPYMAPEQHEGTASEASDQYAFCITLFEALIGRRPFRGSAIDSYAAKVTGQLPPTPKLPPWIRNVIRRGLSPRADDRFASMHELLRALEEPRAKTVWWPWGIAVAGAIAVAATPRQRCASTLQRAEALQRSARDAGEYAVAEADAVFDAWKDYCEARQSGSTALAPIQRCLEQRTAERQELVELWRARRLTETDLTRALGQLPSLSQCSRGDLVRGLPAPPDADAAAVQSVRARLTGANAQLDAGRIDLGLADARAALGDALDLGYAPAIIEAKAAVAQGHAMQGRVPLALEQLQSAYWDAVQMTHLRQMSEIAGRLAFLYGKRQREFSSASRWERYAEAAVEQLGNPPVARAVLTNVLAANRHAAGDFVEAARLYEETVDALLASQSERRAEIALTYANLGEALSSAGQFERAAAMLSESARIRTELFGPNHPSQVGTLAHLARNETRRDNPDQALELYRRALQILDAAHKGWHPWRNVVLLNMGAIHGEAGDYERADAMFEQALAHYDDEGRRDDGWAGLHKNLGTSQQRQGRNADAKLHFELALPLFARNDPRRAESLLALGEVALAEHHVERARSYASQATAAAAEPNARMSERFGRQLADLEDRLANSGPG